MVAITPSAYYTISADSLHKASAKPSHLEKRMASKKVSEEGTSAEQRREAILIAKKANLTRKVQHVREVCEEQKSIQHQNELRKLDAQLNKSEIVYENRRTQHEQKQSVISSHNSKVQLIASTQAQKRAELSQQQKSDDNLKTFIEQVKTVTGDDSDSKAWDISVDELKVSAKKPTSSFTKSMFIGGITSVEARKERLSRRSVQVSFQIQTRNQRVESKRTEIAAAHFAKLAKKNIREMKKDNKDIKSIIAQNEAAFIAAASASLERGLYLADVRRASAIQKRAFPKAVEEKRMKTYSFDIPAKHISSPKPTHLSARFENRSSDLVSKMLKTEERRAKYIRSIQGKATKENRKVTLTNLKFNASQSLKNLQVANEISNKSKIAASNREYFVNSVVFKAGMHNASVKRTGSYSTVNKRIARSAVQQKKFIEAVSKAIECAEAFDKTSFIVDVDSLKVKAGKPMFLEKRLAARSA